MSFKTGHPVCAIGEAGIGKTQILSQIAQEEGMDCYFFYLAHVEREDIGGIPFPNKDGCSYKFLCEEEILKIIKNGRPTILVLDEWNRGEKPVMSSAFTMMESRRFGSYTLPSNVHIVSCMNPSEGSYLVNEAEKDPAFRRRLCFCAVQANVDGWKAYAAGKGNFHPSVVQFVAKHPNILNDTNTRDAGKVYPSPASWEKISDLLKVMDQEKRDVTGNEKDRRLFTLMATGHVGSAASIQFVAFLEDNSTSIIPDEVVKKYRKIRHKIAQLRQDGRNDVLMELADNVALTLASEEPDVGRCGKNVAAFCLDLPDDATVAFLSKLRKYLNEMGKKDTYGIELNSELNENEEFVKAVAELDDTAFAIDEELEAKS